MITAVDAGHGGKDPGAVGPGSKKEADVTLLAAHFLQAHLKAKRHQVVLIRTDQRALDDDKAKDLEKRVCRANAQDCDAYISLHCNGAVEATAGGWEIWHNPGSINGEALAADVRQEVRTAGMVSDGTKARSLKDRGIKVKTYKVLRDTNMPAILIEMAFISNPKEEHLLTDMEWLNQLMEAIATGIENWRRAQGIA